MKKILNKMIQLSALIVFFGLLNAAAQAGEYRVEGDMEVTGKSTLGDLSIQGLDLRVLKVRGGNSQEPRRVIYQGENQTWTNWQDNGDDGFAVMVIDRSDGSVISHINYNLESFGEDNIGSWAWMNEHLLLLDENKIVVITSHGNWNVVGHSFSMGANPFEGMGGSTEAASSTAGSYALIGIPGIGEGKGIEKFDLINMQDGSSKAVDLGIILIGGPDVPYTPLGLIQ